MKMNKTADEQEFTIKKRSVSGDLSGRISDNNKKKTRDLPNLSECQACGFRVDSCSGIGINKIQILYSEWRILLVCSICHYRVISSQICSYCFKETTKDCLTCCQCKRCVHKNCFLKCKNIAPWSYSSCSMEFSICVDCWIPKSTMKRRRFLSCGKNSANCADLGNSNSSVLNGGGNCGVERKIVLALMAKGMMGRKAVMANRAIEMESNALDLGVKRDSVGEYDKSFAVDDAELAFQLHRTMNSSPRISKNLDVVNSSCFHAPMKQGCDHALIGVSDSGNPNVCLNTEICTNKKLNEHNTDRSILDALICTKNDDLAAQLKEGEGSCSYNVLKSSGDETSANFDSRSSLNNQCESTLCKVEICNGKPDRFLLKYRKRNSRSEPVLDYKSKIEIYNRKPAHYLLKYRRRNPLSVEKGNGKSDRFLLKYRRRYPSSKPFLDYKSKVEICNGKSARYLLQYGRRNSSSTKVQDFRSKILSEILPSSSTQYTSSLLICGYN